MSDYANIRELMPIEGRRIVGVTQHDLLEYMLGSPAYVMLHLDDGSHVRFCVEDGRLFVLLAGEPERRADV